MSAEEFSRYDSMKLFLHQIYEFQKGVRSLVLCTMCRTCASLLSERLERLGYRLPDSVGDRQQGESLLRQPHVSGDRGDIHPQAAQRTLRRGGFHARRDARLRHRRAVRTLLQTKVSGCFIRTSGGQLTAAYSFLICAVNESPAPTPSATSTCGVATYDMPSGVNTWLPTAPQVSITVRSPYFRAGRGTAPVCRTSGLRRSTPRRLFSEYCCGRASRGPPPTNRNAAAG